MSSFLHSLWSQVSLILKCWAAYFIAVLLENKHRHASYNKNSSGRSMALYKNVVIVRMDREALAGDPDEDVSCIYYI